MYLLFIKRVGHYFGSRHRLERVFQGFRDHTVLQNIVSGARQTVMVLFWGSGRLFRCSLRGRLQLTFLLGLPQRFPLLPVLSIRTINVSHGLAGLVNGQFIRNVFPVTDCCCCRYCGGGVIARHWLTEEASGRIQGSNPLDNLAGQGSLLGVASRLKLGLAFQGKVAESSKVRLAGCSVRGLAWFSYE